MKSFKTHLEHGKSFRSSRVDCGNPQWRGSRIRNYHDKVSGGGALYVIQVQNPQRACEPAIYLPARMPVFEELGVPMTVEGSVARHTIAGQLGRLSQAVEHALSSVTRRPAPEAVHEARISMRRLQAALRSLKHFLPAPERRVCKHVLTGILKDCGALRDADVRSGLVRHWLIRSGLKDHSQARLLRQTAARERLKARRELQTRILAPKWGNRRWDLRQNALMLVNSEGPDIPASLSEEVCERYQRRLRNLPKIARKPRQLHRLRLRIKDARYFLEDFGPLLGVNLERHLPRLSNLQKALGDLHDESQLSDWLLAQDKCLRLTGELLIRLKVHKRRLLKHARDLRDSLGP